MQKLQLITWATKKQNCCLAWGIRYINISPFSASSAWTLLDSKNESQTKASFLRQLLFYILTFLDQQGE
jgi:hypothetical protein